MLKKADLEIRRLGIFCPAHDFDDEPAPVVDRRLKFWSRSLTSGSIVASQVILPGDHLLNCRYFDRRRVG